MNYANTELAELVCTRISHDLIGNIGAISSGLELVEECDNVLDDDTKNILTTGTNTLKARQKFFRIAFGIDSKKSDMSEVINICQDYLNTIAGKNTPIEVEVKNASPELAKLVCLCTMIGAEVFIKGGKISLEINKDNMIVHVASNYKLSANKLVVYQNILQNKKPEDNISQFIHLIYLQEFLGHNVPLYLDYTETEMKIVIG